MGMHARIHTHIKHMRAHTHTTDKKHSQTHNRHTDTDSQRHRQRYNGDTDKHTDTETYTHSMGEKTSVLSSLSVCTFCLPMISCPGQFSSDVGVLFLSVTD